MQKTIVLTACLAWIAAAGGCAGGPGLMGWKDGGGGEPARNSCGCERRCNCYHCQTGLGKCICNE